MILICQLFHLNYHLNLLFFHHHLHFHNLHFYNNHLHLCFHIYFHNLHLYFLLFCFLLFHFHFLDFLILMFYQLKLCDKLLNKFDNFLFPGVRFLYFIVSAFFISFNLLKYFLGSFALIVLFSVLLTKSLMSIYLNSPILFL